MAKNLSINLLPVEYAQVYAADERFRKIQRIGISILVLLIFLSSTTFALSLLQNSNILQAQAKLQVEESAINKFKPQEESVILLKDRLNSLQKLSTAPSQSSAMYSLVDALMSASISPTLIVTDTSGNLSLSLATTNSSEIDNFIASLTNPQKNQNLVSKVDVESLSRGKDGLYRVNLKIFSK
ncbi:MAG: hypothetical protein HYW45_03650 [Candidatus Daviesbacteria bacterium]|nr:MAG: hypothetical protein HYW45_03650 [Candidatus Daviesbacteria bacterium]